MDLAISDTTYPVIHVFRTSARARMVPVQQVLLVQFTMKKSAILAIPVIVYQVAPVFKTNVLAQMVPVQPVPTAQPIMARSAVRAILDTV